MAASSGPKPAAHLSRSSKALWRKIVSEYEMERHHFELLRLALEARDRAVQARDELEVAGSVTVTDRFGQLKAHPAVAIERDARAAYARLIRQLDLEGEVDPLYRRR